MRDDGDERRFDTRAISRTISVAARGTRTKVPAAFEFGRPHTYMYVHFLHVCCRTAEIRINYFVQTNERKIVRATVSRESAVPGCRLLETLSPEHNV